MISSDATISVRKDGAVWSITLDRPEKRNALNTSMIDVLTDIFAEASQSDCRMICLKSSHANVFCAGADVDELRADRSSLMQLLESLARLLAEMNAAKPIIATLLEGKAYGAGGVLVGMSDLVIASDTSEIAFTEIEMGMYPIFVHTALADRIPTARLFQLCVTGEKLSSEAARQLGLVADVIPAPKFAQSASDRIAWYEDRLPALLMGKLWRRADQNSPLCGKLNAAIPAFVEHLEQIIGEA